MRIIDLTLDEDNPVVGAHNTTTPNEHPRAPSVAGGPDPLKSHGPAPHIPSSSLAPKPPYLSEILSVEAPRHPTAHVLPNDATCRAASSYGTAKLTAVLHKAQTERVSDDPSTLRFSKHKRKSQNVKRMYPSSDDDVVIIERPADAEQYRRHNRSKMRRLDHPPSEYEATDSEAEYETAHAGYTPAPSNWKTFPESTFKPVDKSATTSLSVLPLSGAQMKERGTKGSCVTYRRNPCSSRPAKGEYGMWDWFVDLGYRQAAERHSKHKAALSGSIRHRGSDKRYTSQSAVNFPRVSLTREYGGLPGPMTSIVQSQDIIAISSRTVEGDADDLQLEDDVKPNSFNRSGALHLWVNEEWHGLDAHKRRFLRQKVDEKGELVRDHSFDKFYDVTDVKFDPKQPTCVVSAGRDGFIRVQDIDREKPLVGRRTVEFLPGRGDGRYNTGHYPHTLRFRDSDASALAIASTDGYIYIYNGPLLQDDHDPSLCIKLNVAHGKAHNAGEMAWGRSNILYASSEPRDLEHDHKGYHAAFDVSRPNAFTKFPDAHDSGDSMAIDSIGQNFALITRAADGVHTLRLYDVARQMGAKASSKISLESFIFECDPSLHLASEVTSTSFSPDGRLLAIARNDDRMHIYDTRYLGKGPLLRFYHWGELREDAATGWDNEKVSHYGITCVRWVEGWYGHGLGIVSGGGDGCVRLWDAMGSDTNPWNGEVMAETSWSIGCFSLGDQSKGEKPLVVGDNGGRVYIHDRTSRREEAAP